MGHYQNPRPSPSTCLGVAASLALFQPPVQEGNSAFQVDLVAAFVELHLLHFSGTTILFRRWLKNPQITATLIRVSRGVQNNVSRPPREIPHMPTRSASMRGSSRTSSRRRWSPSSLSGGSRTPFTDRFQARLPRCRPNRRSAGPPSSRRLISRSSSCRSWRVLGCRTRARSACGLRSTRGDPRCR